MGLAGNALYPDPQTEHRGAILMYHRIAPQPTNSLTVSVAHFEAHLQVLTGGRYVLLSLAELAARAAVDDLPPRAIAITFDDGYANCLPETVRLLAVYGLGATFFIVGRALEPGYRYWWDIIDELFATDQQLPESLLFQEHDLKLVLSTRTADDRRVARGHVAQRLYEATVDERDRLIDRLLAWSGHTHCENGPRPITYRELAWLAGQPDIHIGAHTENHLWLPKHSNETQLQELMGAKTRLEGLLRIPVPSVSYPYGACSATTVALAAQAGYSLAVTAEGGGVTVGSVPLALPRYEAVDCDKGAFASFLRAHLP